MWFIYALATSLCWGLGYALSEKLLHNGVSPAFVMFVICLGGLPVYFLWSAQGGSLKSSWDIVAQNGDLLKYTIAMVVIFVCGNLLIMKSVALKNATYANIIEITYPVFTVLFTFLFFKTVHLNYTAANRRCVYYARCYADAI